VIMRVMLVTHVGATLRDMPPIRTVSGAGKDGRMGSLVRALPEVTR
jgi:hypothetical protein